MTLTAIYCVEGKKTETENKTENKICDENNILMWFQETFIQR